MARFELRPPFPVPSGSDWGASAGQSRFYPGRSGVGVAARTTTVDDRLGVLQQLVDFWHGPIKAEDGMSEAERAGGPLPRPLHHWRYRWAGKRTGIMSGQNMLFAPSERHKYWEPTDEGHRFFYVESEGV
jgi:hypothetical protein